MSIISPFFPHSLPPPLLLYLGLFPKLLSIDFLHLHLCVGLLVHRALHQDRQRNGSKLSSREKRCFYQRESVQVSLCTTSACSSSRVFRRLRTGLATAAVPLVRRCPMAIGSMSSRLLALMMTSTPCRDRNTTISSESLWKHSLQSIHSSEDVLDSRK